MLNKKILPRLVLMMAEEEMLVIKHVRNTVPSLYIIKDLHSDKIAGVFYT